MRNCLMGSAALIAASMIAACADTSEPQLEERESAVVSGATNVALAGTASASSTYSRTSVTFANDGLTSTNWASANTAVTGSYTESTWLKITFGTAKSLNEISVGFPSVPDAYQLQYCSSKKTCTDDGTGWAVPPGSTSSSSGYVRLFLDGRVDATAVRVVYISGSGRAQASELEAWTYPAEWNTGGYDCNAVCTSTTPWNTECRHETTLKHTTCGQYGIYGGCKSWCDGDLGILRGCSASCTAPDGSESSCGASGYQCVVDEMGQQETPLCKDVCTYQASAYHTVCKMLSTSAPTTCQEYGIYHPAEPIRGSVSTSGGTDVNRCAFGLELQVNLMSVNDTIGEIFYDHDLLGFEPTCGTPFITGSKHWQGIQRLTNDPTLFVMSASDEDGVAGRLAHGTIPDGGTMTRDDALKPVVTSLTATATNHPGGMQALGNWVFVGLETYDNSSAPSYIQQWSVGPSGFSQVGGSYYLGPDSPSAPYGASAVAITKLRPMAGEGGSRFLMLVPRYGDSHFLQFYLTPPAVSLGAGLSSFYPAGAVDMRPDGDFVNGWTGFSNVNFVTDCNGDLYLFGMVSSESSCPDSGDDWMKVYRISYQFEPVTEKLVVSQLSPPTNEVHVLLSGHSSLAAASGIYVTPANKLVLMATQHTLSSNYIDISENTVP